MVHAVSEKVNAEPTFPVSTHPCSILLAELLIVILFSLLLICLHFAYRPYSLMRREIPGHVEWH